MNKPLHLFQPDFMKIQISIKYSMIMQKYKKPLKVSSQIEYKANFQIELSVMIFKTSIFLSFILQKREKALTNNNNGYTNVSCIIQYI